MKIKITLNLDDNDRTAINGFNGKQGCADRHTCQQFMINAVNSAIDDLFPCPGKGGDDEQRT